MSGLDDLISSVAGGTGGGLGGLLGGLAGGAGTDAGLSDLLGGLAGDGDGAAGGGIGSLLTALLPVVGGMLADGGLQKVLSGFDANGLAAQAGSWVGMGQNAPISGDDVRKVVGDAQLAEIAGELGVSEDEAADAVAQVLPAVVDAVSPEGHLPPADELEAELEKLGGGAAGEAPTAG